MGQKCQFRDKKIKITGVVLYYTTPVIL